MGSKSLVYAFNPATSSL